MSLYQVIIQPEAEAELDEAYAFFESQQPGLGLELLANLSETISLLEDNPLIFQKVYGEKRRAIVKRFGYNVIYKVVDKNVFILAIMHGNRDPWHWKIRG
ncbi:MAG: type II toxin-antitoxin system RelE/ParE family toxin [Saprospiraceae bacterium]|nr:type II toxin-antitoxin system RelE/ParE family toxin [Saprospiraceae bacterium]